MEIIELKPQGFCKGVITALQIVENALNDQTLPKPVYILGQIIHNKEVINDFSLKGAITIHEKGKTRLELLNSIDNGTIIFSAHGVSKKVYDLAKKKNLHIIDASCEYVRKIQNKILEMISDGYEIIYIGVNNHPESEGILGCSDKINFVTSLHDVNSLNIKSNKIFVANQTTLGIFDTENIYKLILEKYPSAIIDNSICKATTQRQLAIMNQKEVDLCIIIGDKESSNTKKLFSIGKDYTKINTVLIEKLNDLDSSLLKNIKSVSISSGASTPRYLVNEVIEYIKKNND